jgi:hypothetical protein
MVATLIIHEFSHFTWRCLGYGTDAQRPRISQGVDLNDLLNRPWNAMIGTRSLVEFTADRLTLDFSCEPFCQLVRLEFNYGSEGRCYRIDVPIEAYNNEVSSPAYCLPHFFPLSDDIMIFTFDLPLGDVPWADALKQLAKYLNPPHNNNKRVTNSPELPCFVSATFALPLYIIARRCRLDRLADLVSSAIRDSCQLSQAIAIVGQIAALSCYDYDFVDPLFQMLANSLDTIPVQAFRGIEMAKAVLAVLAKADPESDPPAVIEWLVIAFRQFEELHVHETELIEILARLHFTSDLATFLGWLFSTVCDSQAGVDRFLSILPHFKIERIELLMSLPVDRLLWLFNEVDPVTNRAAIQNVVCARLRLMQSDDKQRIFDFAAAHGFLSFDEFPGQDLDVLLPFASAHSSTSFTDVVTALKKSVITWKQAIDNRRIPELLTLSWDQMLTVFHIGWQPKPSDLSDHPSQEMRAAFRQLDARFFHWLIANRESVTMTIIRQYLKLPSTEVSHQRKPHRRLIVIDIMHKIDNPDAFREKSLIINDFEYRADFVDVLAKLNTKSAIELQRQTLDLINRHCGGGFLRLQFVEFLRKAVDAAVAVEFLLPINEATIVAALEIVASLETPIPPAVFVHLASVVKLVIGMLPPQSLGMIIGNIPFLNIFDFDGPALLGDEDIAVNYLMAEPPSQANPGLVNWPHMSLRLASFLWWEDFAEFHFQFPVADPIYDVPQLPVSIWYQTNCVPRPGTYLNLASVRPRHAIVYVLGQLDERTQLCVIDFFKRMFVFIGVVEAENPVIFVTADTRYQPGYDVTILWLPTHCQQISNFDMLLEDISGLSRVPPLVISAKACVEIMDHSATAWRQLFRESVVPKFSECDHDVTHGVWSEPSPTLLPDRRDLFKWAMNPDGTDWFLGSVPFSADAGRKWSAEMGLVGGRLIAGAVAESPVAVFNLDFIRCTAAAPLSEETRICWFARFRHMALSMLSLMCEAMAGGTFHVASPIVNGEFN